MRAILPFVGDLASSLFGVATSSDVRKLQKHVSRLYKMQISSSAGSVAFLNKVSSYMKTSNHRMDNLIGSIMSIHSRMDNITDIPEPTHTTRSSVSCPHSVLQVTTDYSSGTLTGITPAGRYLSHTPTTPSNDSYVPIASTTTRFDLYQVMTFPVPFNASSSHATLVTNLPDFVAVPTDQHYIIELTTSQMLLCHGTHNKFCPDKFPHHAISDQSCASAMIRKTDVRRHCKFDFVEAAIVPSIIELDEGTLLLTNISDIILTCHNEVTRKPGCSFCVMKLPCFCSVLAGSFSFSPRLAACQDTSPITLATSPGINLALLQQFFNHSSISDVNSDQLYRFQTFPTPFPI
ncbi:uncharacterized protein LOC143288249 [Babylonia areolata]|uniref:uncharacterized protein LOC143288249 n=1 Tax=Babylonia areolata TaxID=304850 RepID=UPI003FD37DE1